MVLWHSCMAFPAINFPPVCPGIFLTLLWRRYGFFFSYSSLKSRFLEYWRGGHEYYVALCSTGIHMWSTFWNNAWFSVSSNLFPSSYLASFSCPLVAGNKRTPSIHFAALAEKFTVQNKWIIGCIRSGHWSRLFWCSYSCFSTLVWVTGIPKCNKKQFRLLTEL